ncbi:hypothetical protein SteCoe_26970 [Stentor coeruleus]|uniref:SET domain-containing protein n=1 Tax=Stentor coeruleus TaxID=5963 RepID=A0A1R2BBY3_9CILI|nr:hypothetical protein SteCoe_26970 [Stentor coeruleus]
MYTPLCDYWPTLTLLLQEDFNKAQKLNINQVKTRYEGWACYLLARGNFQELKNFKLDLQTVTKLTENEILEFFSNLNVQISFNMMVYCDFSEPQILSYNKLQGIEKSGYDVDMKQKSIESHDHAATEESSEKTPDFAGNLFEIEVMDLCEPVYDIEEFFICGNLRGNEYHNLSVGYNSINCRDYKSPCKCENSSCSNPYMCSCSEFYDRKLGQQRALLIVNSKKLIPRNWKDDHAIFECSDSCSCNKCDCFLTFFDSKFSPLLSLFLTSSGYVTTKNFQRGEFVLELSGELRNLPTQKAIQLSDKIYLEIEESNLKSIINDLMGNVFPVRIFSYVENKVICRVGLFAERNIKCGELIKLNYSKLSLFDPSIY